MTTKKPTRQEQTAIAEVQLGRGRRPQARKLRDAKDAMYREHIMEVAERIFADQGFANTKMQDIAAVAGISLGTLYQSYESKQVLHRSILIERDRQMLNLVMERRQRGLQVPESVEHVLLFMETHLRFLLEHPEYLRMQLQEGHAWYHASAQPTEDEQQMWDRGLFFLEQVLQWGIKQNLFSPGDTRHLARMVLAMQQTRLANWVMDGMAATHETVIGQVQSDFVRLFCPPQVASKLLSSNGDGLNQKTQKRIRALEEESGSA